MARSFLIGAAPFVAVLAACGTTASTPAAQGPGAATRGSSAEYNRCKEEGQDGDASACWSRFIKRFGDLASQAEHDFAQAYLDAHRHTNSAQENHDMSQAAARQSAPSESIDPTPVNVGSTGAAAGGAQPTSATTTYPTARVGHADCYNDLSLPADGSVGLQRLTDRCGAATGMIPVSTVHQKSQTSAADPDVFGLELDANSCYRIFAVGESGIQSMRAMVTTADGKVLAADVSGDRAPIVGPTKPFCVTQAGSYKYVVAVIKGSGTYFFQMWNAPPGSGGSAAVPGTSG